ncbi:c-type cytochrome [Azospirillum endophyticum]
MRRTVKTLALAGVAAGIGGLLFAWSGLYSVAASREHWAPVEMFFEMAMRRSVETHAAFIDPPPDLDDPALVRRGAGHYEDGCAPCHGAPDAPRNPISRHMMPEPPYLPDKVADWKPRELYWITLHGIKYAGMPAWPAQQRTDEPWAVTAFLLRLKGMNAEEYRSLAFGRVQADAHAHVTELTGPTGAPAGSPMVRGMGETLQDCARCHGYDGNGDTAGAFPRIAGQSADYLYETLRAYAGGDRFSGIMQPVAAGLDDAALRALAEHYAAQKPATATLEADSPDPGRLELGRRIAASGAPEKGVAACSGCHGGVGGDSGPARDARYPSLDGQHASFIAGQLRLWRDGARGNTALSRIMEAAVRRMTDEQIDAVAEYYSRRAPERVMVKGDDGKS